MSMRCSANCFEDELKLRDTLSAFMELASGNDIGPFLYKVTGFYKVSLMPMIGYVNSLSDKQI